MKWFLNKKIAVKLISSFLVVAVIAGIVGGVGLININRISDADVLLYEENLLGVDYSGEAAEYFQRIRFNTIKMIAIDDTSELSGLFNNVDTYIIKVDELLQEYEDGIVSETDRMLFGEAKPAWEKYKTITDDYLKLIQASQIEEAKKLNFGEMGTAGDSVRITFGKLNEFNVEGAKQRSAENEMLAKTSSIIMLVVVAIGVIIAILLGTVIARIISNPIKEMVMTADALAQGDINVDVKTDTKDEIGDLAESFRDMIENIHNQARIAESIADGDLSIDVKVRSEKDLLNMKFKEIVVKNNEIMTNIANAADQVATGSGQVSNSSMELSQGAAEQASSVEELTASLEEVSSQTDVNAKNANDANELAEAAKENAIQGNAKMHDMVKAMEEINDSSANISKIIKVIDEIAFQTNILALNAAVEAARAGQHGKGFAVVAEEVRNLAARSADAAKETTEMIENSIKKSEGGTQIANETAKALNQIVEEVAKAADLVGDIAIASNEQAAAIEQINQGIMQVSQVVQANSATSEEGAAASEELAGQAEFLKESVAKFKLSDTYKAEHRHSSYDTEDIKLIENISAKNGDKEKVRTSEKNGNGAHSKTAISADDKEFGKY